MTEKGIGNRKYFLYICFYLLYKRLIIVDILISNNEVSKYSSKGTFVLVQKSKQIFNLDEGHRLKLCISYFIIDTLQ